MRRAHQGHQSPQLPTTRNDDASRHTSRGQLLRPVKRGLCGGGRAPTLSESGLTEATERVPGGHFVGKVATWLEASAKLDAA